MFSFPTDVIETDRLILRLPQESDVEPLRQVFEDPEVLRWVAPGTPGGVTVAWRNVASMVGHWCLRGFGHWVVVEKATAEVIGRVGLYHPDGWPGIELGWVIRRSRWGCGFATEASKAALDWAWRSPTVTTDRIVSLITPDNVPSIAVATKVGERFESIHKRDEELLHIYVIDRPSTSP